MFPTPLPLELTNMIIDHLHDTADRDNRHTLAMCALVCRAWVPESRFHLFRKLWLAPARVQPFLDLLSAPLATIRLRFVRHLHMRPVDRRAWREENSLDGLLAWTGSDGCDLAGALSRLTKLTLHFVHWCKLGERARSALLSGFRAVTFLDLVVHRFTRGASLTRVLSSFPALRDLELGYLEREYTPAGAEGALPPGLRSLKLKGTPEAFVDELARAGPFPALRTLKLIERNATRFTARKLAAVARLLAAIGPFLHALELRARHVPHYLPAFMPPGEPAALPSPPVREHERDTDGLALGDVFADAVGLDANTDLRRLAVQGLDEALAPALLRRVSSGDLQRVEFALLGITHGAAFDALPVDWAGLAETLERPQFARTKLVVHVLPAPAPAPPMIEEGGSGIDVLQAPVYQEPEGDETDYVRQRLADLLRGCVGRSMLQVD